jgi:hypothetical protein
LREIVGQQLIRIETAGRHKPSQTPRSHSGDTESNAVAGAEFLALAFEEGDESLTHVAEANDAEVIGADSGALRGEVAVPTILNAGPSPERAALGGWEFLPLFRTYFHSSRIHSGGSGHGIVGRGKTRPMDFRWLRYNLELS